MYKMNGAELIVNLLIRQGIELVAGIPGGANLPLYDALYSSTDLTHILCRHEQGAGFLAQGLARSTGKVGVCFATSGPGATNIVTAIADAYLDSIPIICITGQVPKSMIGTDAFQEVDTYGLSIPITKHNFIARSPEELLNIIPKAFELALSGRPGPVWIDIPKDVQLGKVTFSDWPEAGKKLEIEPEAIDKLLLAAKMISEAKQPIMCLGGGLIHAGAAAEAKALIEKNSLPTVMTLMGLGALPVNHPLALGMLGMHGARSTNLALQDCDLFIAAGARFDDRATGKLVEFCPEASVIHIDIDPSEVSKLKTATIGLVGDLRSILTDLLPHVESRRRQKWNNRINQLQKKYPMTSPEVVIPDKPYGMILNVAKLIDEDSFIVTDVGKHQMWVAQVFPFRFPRQFVTSGGLGTMGFGLPTAIGVAIATPDKQVVLLTGDGSLQMNIQELITAVELQVNLKIVIFNNNSLGLVRQQQNLFYNRHYYACDFKLGVDFVTVAEGFHMKGYNVDPGDNFVNLFTRVLAEPGPCLINVPIGRDEEVYPMVPPGASNAIMVGGVNADFK